MTKAIDLLNLHVRNYEKNLQTVDVEFNRMARALSYLLSELESSVGLQGEYRKSVVKNALHHLFGETQ